MTMQASVTARGISAGRPHQYIGRRSDIQSMATCLVGCNTGTYGASRLVASGDVYKQMVLELEKTRDRCEAKTSWDFAIAIASHHLGLWVLIFCFLVVLDLWVLVNLMARAGDGLDGRYRPCLLACVLTVQCSSASNVP
jgi:hypothetical protein